MRIEPDPFLNWVLREHGPQVREAVSRKLPESSDPVALVRETLIELHPGDFEFNPALEALPHGFCSD